MITISKDNYQKILAHAQKNLPEEACGLIAGRLEGSDKHIEKVYLLTNIDHSNEHFSLDPKEQLAVRWTPRNSLPPSRTCVQTASRRWATGIPIRNPLRARRKKTSVLPTIAGRAT